MDPTDDRCNWVTQFFGRTPLMKVCAVLSSDGQYLIYKSPARLCTYTMVLHLNMFGPGMNNMTVIDGQAPLVMFQSQDRAVSQWFERDIWNGRFRTSPLLGHGRKSTDNVEGIFLSQHRYRQQLLETDGMTNFIQRGHWVIWLIRCWFGRRCWHKTVYVCLLLSTWLRFDFVEVFETKFSFQFFNRSWISGVLDTCCEVVWLIQMLDPSQSNLSFPDIQISAATSLFDTTLLLFITVFSQSSGMGTWYWCDGARLWCSLSAFSCSWVDWTW